MNKRKAYGIILCIAGVALAKGRVLILLDDTPALLCYALGIFVAFAGLAVYATGMKGRVDKRIRVCRNCFFKNDAAREHCVKCKKPLREHGEPL